MFNTHHCYQEYNIIPTLVVTVHGVVGVAQPGTRQDFLFIIGEGVGEGNPLFCGPNQK